jgi:colanic acid biosynthesis glycosyl transferase WcaI
LIEAATLLKDEADMRFLLIGSGHGHARVEAEIARRALGNILLKPMQPRCDLADSLSASDVHLISLRPELEPYVVPSKLYGIMAAGRPCLFIGAGNGEVAETLRRHDCGEQVAIGASQDLAKRIAIMRDTPIERLKMGRRARRAFEGEYSRDAGILAWLALLSDLGLVPAQSAALADT